MEIKNFKDMYIAELQELCSVEKQLAELLAHISAGATHPGLKNVMSNHQREVMIQRSRLESILKKHSADPNAHTDQAMQGLLSETDKMLEMLKGNELRDAGLIASVQKLEHYQIAAYGTAAALPAI